MWDLDRGKMNSYLSLVSSIFERLWDLGFRAFAWRFRGNAIDF